MRRLIAGGTPGATGSAATKQRERHRPGERRLRRVPCTDGLCVKRFHGVMVAAYYNEFDPYAAQWLRNLIARGLIAPGDVDDRSIIMPLAHENIFEIRLDCI